MEVWLNFIIVGLVMDIVGIWLIALPLLKKVFKNEEDWDKRVRKSVRDLEKATKDKDNGVINNATAFDLARVEAYLYRVINFMYKDNNLLRKLTIMGLIIITLGFIFQIIGNYIQPVYVSESQ